MTPTAIIDNALAALLERLLERLKAATGPDQELDARILCAVAAPAASFVERSAFNGVWCIYCGEYRGAPRLWEDRKWGRQTAWNMTASIDTALALVEKMLPGWRGDIDTAPFDPGDLCGARLFEPGKITNVVGEAATPPLAILAALLSALIARGAK